MRTEYVRPEYLLPLIGYDERLGNKALPVLTILFVAILLFPSSWRGSVAMSSFGWVLVSAGLMLLVLGIAVNARKKTRSSSLSKQPS